jgi:hypothetical protein
MDKIPSGDQAVRDMPEHDKSIISFFDGESILDKNRPKRQSQDQTGLPRLPP